MSATDFDPSHKAHADTLHVLSIAYPFAAVGRDAVGGAEQVLATVEEGLVRRGHRSTVVALRGSRVRGELIEVDATEGAISDAVRAITWERYRAAIDRVLRGNRIDVIHMHGVDFHRYVPECSTPVVVTLHLPPDRYPVEIFERAGSGRLVLQCVSRSQRLACPPDDATLECVENGVPVESFALSPGVGGRGRYTLMLARICEEKGIHVGLEAAHRAGTGLLIGGEVFPYPAHLRYFEQRVVPLLDARRRFLGPIGFERKRRLLAGARCVLIPSLVAETSSLVAMEALASGTPVIAFPNGALTEIIEHGRTGFLVADVGEIADAIHEVDRLDRSACRAVARERFSADDMVDAYLRLYRRILSTGVTPANPQREPVAC